MLTGLISLSLLLSSTACVKPRTHVAMVPPAAYMEDCVETKVDVAVNGDLLRKIKRLRVDLAECNEDKAALREWAKGVTKATK